MSNIENISYAVVLGQSPPTMGMAEWMDCPSASECRMKNTCVYVGMNYSGRRETIGMRVAQIIGEPNS